ncbi:MAG: hypothetical protein NWQ19_05300 [Nonlabens sp.]|nr:hypothetical protein [Nonlabens sp.]
MKKLFFLGLLSVATLSSCDRETELRTVNTSSSASALVSFSNTNYDFPVEINTSGTTFDVPVNVSTLSTEARTFNVVVEADSDADPANYSVPGSVTIPANSYNGILQVTGNDVTLETTTTTIVISLIGDDLVNAGPSANIRLFQVCPVPSDYMVGQYQITNLVSRFGRSLIETKVATITAPSPTSRAFSNKLLGGSSDSNVVLSLVCNEIIFTQVSSTLQCTTGNLIQYGPATNNSAYDVTDDSLFLVNYNFDITNSCAASPTQTNSSFIMTKL